MATVRESEEQEAVPAGTGNFRGYSAERAEMPLLILEAVFQYLDQNIASLKAARKQRAGWNVRIAGKGDGTVACSFTEIAQGLGLQPPGNPAEQVELVERS